jgi:hypothetical protein
MRRGGLLEIQRLFDFLGDMSRQKARGTKRCKNDSEHSSLRVPSVLAWLRAVAYGFLLSCPDALITMLQESTIFEIHRHVTLDGE